MRLETYAVPCDACEGTGFIQESPNRYLLCTKCEGDCRLLIVPKVPALSLGWRYTIAFCAVAVGFALFYWFLLAPAIDALTRNGL